jgi:hypothetical protein
MTQTDDICLPTPLYIQVFGRREDRKGIEPNDENTTLEQPTALTAKLEDEPLSA